MKGQNILTEHNITVSVPEVALLELVSEESENVKLFASAPGEVGSRLNLSQLRTISGIWVNYSSISENKNHLRTVVATVMDRIPSGLRLMVDVSEATGEGRGMLGKPAGLIHLSGEPSELISGIGSCFTGQGINNGHYLNYMLETDDPDATNALLAQQDLVVNVIYTLTDNN